MTISPLVDTWLGLDTNDVPKDQFQSWARLVEHHGNYSFRFFAVKDRDLATPPGSPADDDAYIIAASPTGAWAGHAGKVAMWYRSTWNIFTPAEGWAAWVNDEDVLVFYSGTVWNAFSSGSSGREKLTAARTYYVRADGSNSNNGLANTSGGAFLTLQKAYDTITQNLDLGGQTVTVQIGDGTYTGQLAVAQPWTGGGSVIFQGNSSTPANVLISTVSACVDVTCALPGELRIKDMKLTSSASSGIWHRGTGLLRHQNVDFGSVAAYHLRASSPGALLYSANNYTVSAGAIAHFYADGLAKIQHDTGTITFSGTPAFSGATATAIRLGHIFIDVASSSNITGAATGVRYSVTLNGVIDTRAVASLQFPGNSAGSTATGGQYN